MRTRRDDPTFPFCLDPNNDDCQYHEPGLSKREYFAAAALQGILANPEFMQSMAAEIAIQQADKLIELLNKTDTINENKQ